ncbi:SET domain protein [Mycena alexandri]|uniref:SET domain protein n=1 Tax=Mycena alexandri TaxID=1745969 RepID=A0AAD6TET4_9AGAR|nr:SET domain protein [Mycena alexandri]
MSAEDPLRELKEWLQNNGGYFHPGVRFQRVDSGFSVVAWESLPPDSKMVSCPFSLVITKHIALKALSVLLGSTTNMSAWTERQLIASYLCFHWIIGDDKSSTNVLAHLPYVKSLPSRDKLRTPLHFTENELQQLQGSNLYGATLDRGREWKAEWQDCRSAIGTVNTEWADRFTWELYLTAATHLSSRAFPSTLISQNLSLTSPSDPEPILLPGVDSLNHRRAEPVSWVQSYLGTGPVPEPGSSISLVLHNPTPAGTELFNNYGAKPNSELILGYGFVIPDNPDDTIVLKIGGMEGKKWEVGREARGADGVWDSVLEIMTGGAEPTYEDYLDAAGTLGQMAQGLLDKLPPKVPRPDTRDDVAWMIDNYLEGQRDILEALILYAGAKSDHGLAMAKEQGIEIGSESESE